MTRWYSAAAVRKRWRSLPPAIRFRIVPGVSAGIGGAAAAGIPVTHRGLAHSVAFVTGHDASGELPDLDWTALARGADVLVLYMALRRIGAIAAYLRAAGRPGTEPVAFVTEATTPRQRVASPRWPTRSVSRPPSHRMRQR